MKFLSRAEILAAQDLKPEAVPVPEWGGEVLLIPGTGDERDQFDASIMEGKGKDREVNTKRLRVKLLSMAIVNEDGMRLFSEFDLEALAKKSSKVIDRLFRRAQQLWGLSKEDVESLVGESKAAQSSDSGTGLPSNGAAPLAN